MFLRINKIIVHLAIKGPILNAVLTLSCRLSLMYNNNINQPEKEVTLWKILQ